jgi:thiosulfate/3-mercaptopyruvate sulfurtransferase
MHERRSVMEKKLYLVVPALIFCAAFLLSGEASAEKKPSRVRAIEPVVSADWLAANMENLVILDIRSSADYEAGHIPGSINEPFAVPFSAWVTMRDDLLLEVPEADNLFETIGNLGISNDSRVVIVTAPNPGEPPFYGFANATRVALTLIYAGVKNVAILDGGYPKWAAEGKTVTTDEPADMPSEYTGNINHTILVPIEYVHKHLRSADIIDARDADVYFGVTIEPFADKAGHIPTAVSLPAPWIWKLEQDGSYLYKDAETLRAMASGVLREPWGDKSQLNQEIIVYCGVGGYASSWWFVLTQVLGYRNVGLYDGAAQEWVRYYDMVPYQWE